MKFEDAKLPQNEVIEKAFNHAQESLKDVGSEIAEKLAANVEMLKEASTQLDALKESGQMSENEYNMRKTQVTQQLKALANIPAVVERQLDAIFRQKILAPAKELQSFSDNASPDVIAAALLLDSAPDPVDFDQIVANFSKTVSDTVKNVLHIGTHRSAVAQEANLAQASEDEKRIFKAELALNIQQLPLQAMQMQLPPGAVKMPEKALFRPIAQLWGGDKKQDARLVDVFNRTAAALRSPFKIEVNDNKPMLVENKAPKALPPGPRPPLKGDDGF